MRKFVEKQQKPKPQKKSNQSREDQIKAVIDSYVNSPVESCGVSLWKKFSKSNCSIERALSAVAKKYQTPPASTISVERLFSVGGRILSDYRKKLKAKSASMLMFCTLCNQSFLNENACSGDESSAKVLFK